MVFSTAKPQLATQIEQLGIKFSKRLEVSEPKELTPDELRSASVRMNSFPSSSAPVKTNKLPAVAAPHPVYGMGLAQNGEPRKKKIVIPPSGAW